MTIPAYTQEGICKNYQTNNKTKNYSFIIHKGSLFCNSFSTNEQISTKKRKTKKAYTRCSRLMCKLPSYPDVITNCEVASSILNTESIFLLSPIHHINWAHNTHNTDDSLSHSLNGRWILPILCAESNILNRIKIYIYNLNQTKAEHM